MRLAAAATDYDGTLTRTGRLAPVTIAGLRELRAGGLPLVLVTGRILADLRRVCPAADGLFDRIVAENGAVLSAAGRARSLAPPLPVALERALRRRGVRVDRGDVLLATGARHERAAEEEAARLGVRCAAIRNRESLMLLPAGVDKATGLAAAAAELGLSARDFVAFGDAENDAALLAAAGLGVAVGNALPGLVDAADVVLDRAGGPAVVAFLRRLRGVDGHARGAVRGRAWRG